MANIERTVITSSCNHGLNEGDVMQVNLPKSTRLVNLLTKPRMTEFAERIPAKIDTIKLDGPILSKVTIFVGNRGLYKLELTYPDQED